MILSNRLVFNDDKAPPKRSGAGGGRATILAVSNKEIELRLPHRQGVTNAQLVVVLLACRHDLPS